MSEETKTIGYFVCVDGVIWTVYQTGTETHTNYCEDINVDGEQVQILGAYDDTHEGDSSTAGRLIEDEYRLWSSIVDLAVAIEKPAKCDDGSITLDQAVSEQLETIQAFKAYYIAENKEHPDMYPLSLPKNNAGCWFDQMMEFEK
ncbi:hypothetical protein ABMX62_19035 [Vibrio vulnificus]|uniref:hypothetical protein n=1 Tax=Vibrio vulnificus TaxID=672 RepID=UPI004058D318